MRTPTGSVANEDRVVDPRHRGEPRDRGGVGKADLLAEFPPPIARQMRRMAVLQRWPDGASVFCRGERVTRLYLLLRGRIRIAMTAADGEELFIRWSLPGEFVGIVSVVTQRPFPVDAVAFDHCEALTFEWEALKALLETDVESVFVIARIIGQHTSDMTNLLVARTAHTLSARVLAVLEHLAIINAVPQANGERVLPVSQTDVAHAVGASRQAVNEALRSLEKSGHIRLGYRSVVFPARRDAS